MAPGSQALTVLTPKSRVARGFPRTFGLGWCAVVLLSLINPAGRGGAFKDIDGVLKLGAIIAACVVASWLESRTFTALIGRARFLRVAVAFCMPVVFAMGAAFLGLAAGIVLELLGDDGTTGLSLVIAMLWASSASLGSAMVVVIDVVVSAIVQSFRARIQLAVLGLVGFAAGSATLVAIVASRAPELILQYGLSSALRIDLPSGKLTGAALDDALKRPELAQLLTLSVVVAFTALSLPAVLSACGKLADAVMERLHPLSRAFEVVGAGSLDVRVEEGGSRDFRQLSRSFNQMVGALSISQRMERAFGQYVSGQVLSRIREQHGEASLPAELREASVFFADVRGFTAMSEKLEPAQVLGVLNRYFERVVAIIDRYDGYLDKFIGDAVVVVFNGPIDQADHAERATRCAIELQQEVTRLNAEQAFPEIGRLEIGIGVTTGPLVAGNLGSAQHMEYTVIGDTVNLAARLTGQARPGEVWVNEKNAELLPPDLPRQQLPPFSVKGKTQPVVAYRVWPSTASLPPPGGSLPPSGPLG